MLAVLERRFVQANRALLIVLLTVTVVVTFVNVFLRYAGESSFLWGEEVGRHLMIWLAFIAAGWRSATARISASIRSSALCLCARRALCGQRSR